MSLVVKKIVAQIDNDNKIKTSLLLKCASCKSEVISDNEYYAECKKCGMLHIHIPKKFKSIIE